MRTERRISDAEFEWRSCTRKIRYPNVEAAREVAADIYAAEQDALHAYLCGFCGHYHLGHPLHRQAKGLRKRLEKARRKALWKEPNSG